MRRAAAPVLQLGLPLESASSTPHPRRRRMRTPAVRPMVCGVDEAGRGPLAGPVVAAAVMLDPDRPIRGLADSKQLSPRRRAALFDQICEHALAFRIAEANVAEIDALNILGATLLAMRRAVAGLRLTPREVLVDGNRLPTFGLPARAIVQGDATVAEISAASILAKVHRDRLCQRLDAEFPGYGLAEHKGYATAAHLEALSRLGACACHRRSFAPVRQALGLAAEDDAFRSPWPAQPTTLALPFQGTEPGCGGD